MEAAPDVAHRRGQCRSRTGRDAFRQRSPESSKKRATLVRLPSPPSLDPRSFPAQVPASQPCNESVDTMSHLRNAPFGVPSLPARSCYSYVLVDLARRMESEPGSDPVLRAVLRLSCLAFRPCVPKKWLPPCDRSPPTPNWPRRRYTKSWRPSRRTTRCCARLCGRLGQSGERD